MSGNKTYSQVGQDKWVLSLFPKGHKGFFLDLGCNDPSFYNNTLLLEEQGWFGYAFDLSNLKEAWMSRSAEFIQSNVLSYDFENNKNIPKLVDYMSVDVDDLGTNYKTIKRLLELGFDFKALTIEHNLYIGEAFARFERAPQRELLWSLGYILVHGDVDDSDNKFEDWWINPKYITL